MFTQQNVITDLLNERGYAPEGLVYIHKGVMTDKYSFRHADKEYIIRCYPKNRSWLAEVEFHYMELLQGNGVKCPVPIDKWQNGGQAYLLYEKLPGSTLGEVYSQLTEDQKENLCKEIVNNYNKIASISLTSYGIVKAGNSFSHSSWKEFIKDSINDALSLFQKEGNKAKIAIGEGLLEYSEKQDVNEAHLVWSDFSVDNIIVNADGKLAGFIDFEGLMAGDSLLGLGYLIAHEKKSDFVSRIIRLSRVEDKQEIIDFYSVIRFCRLLPYAKNNLPNGERRMPIEEFLSYTSDKMLHFSKCKKFYLSSYWLKWIMLSLTFVLTALSVSCLSYSYHKTLEAGQIHVRCSMSDLKFSSNIPVWFSYNDTALITNRPLDNEDVALLRNLVNDSLVQYPQYLKSLNQLAFLSNASSDNMLWLLLLTLCFVQLGCVARTMYDFIGWTCYKGGQDMERWWSWYLFRPLIGVPIASLLLVAVRTSLFSGLFTSRDLNTYLVISFLAGFSIMEFLKMLRRVSKTLFDGETKSA